MGLIRVFVALAVVITHSKPLFDLPFTRMVMGKLAVQMFYTISGFYMALILNQKYTGRGSYRIFIMSRFLRLFPAYAATGLATILAGVIAYSQFGKLLPLFRNWSIFGPGFAPWTLAYLITTNVILLGQDTVMFLWIPPETGKLAFIGAHYRAPWCQNFMVVPQAWTLGVELWFYLIAPLLVRRLRWIVAAAAVGLTVRLVLIHLMGLVTAPWDYCFFPAELPFFLFGALAFKAYAALQGRGFPLAKIGWIVYPVTLFATLAFYKLPWRLFPYTQHLLGADLLLFLLPCALPFVFAFTKNSSVDRLIGELSYPIYLTHWVVIDLLRLTGSPWVERNLGELVCVLTVSASALLWYLVDRPIDAWRQRFVLEQESPTPVRLRGADLLSSSSATERSGA